MLKLRLIAVPVLTASLLLAAACAPGASVRLPGPTPTATVPATRTQPTPILQGATPRASLAVPSSTVAPTATLPASTHPPSTGTPIPTATRKPTATPQPGVITVNTQVDEADGSCEDGDCSLRDALALALAQPGQLVLLPPGTFTLTLGNLEYLDRSVKLAGAGIDRTVIEPPARLSGDCSRDEYLLSIYGPQEVNITDLTFRHGGIFRHTGPLTLSRVRIVGNHCAGVAGFASSLIIQDSIIEENTGAGITSAYGHIDVSRSTIRRNGLSGIVGLSIQVEGSTISQNGRSQASVYLGGIAGSGHTTITNSTISGNYRAGVTPSDGGAQATIQYSTITGNIVGLLAADVPGTPLTLIEIGNSLVANNPGPMEDPDCSAWRQGDIRSLGHNLIGSITGNISGCNFIPADSDLVGTDDNPIDPKLGPLQDNGGPTQTHALLPGSPAIDAGDNTSCPATDQRGVGRPQGKGCDIGAVEVTPPLMPTPTSPMSAPIRIEAGGDAAYTDAAGNVWRADTGFLGGSTVDRGNIEIADTQDDRVYQTERYGMSGYALAIANGSYTVRLHFAETHSGITGPGQRVFSVNVEGIAINNLDIFAETGGRHRALVKRAVVQISDGQLNLAFTPLYPTA